jgi:hypothetical protein
VWLPRTDRGERASEPELSFCAGGRDRLVRQAEDLFWKTRADVDAKHIFVSRAKKDLLEARAMLAVRNDTLAHAATHTLVREARACPNTLENV